MTSQCSYSDCTTAAVTTIYYIENHKIVRECNYCQPHYQRAVDEISMSNPDISGLIVFEPRALLFNSNNDQYQIIMTSFISSMTIIVDTAYYKIIEYYMTFIQVEGSFYYRIYEILCAFNITISKIVYSRLAEGGIDAVLILESSSGEIVHRLDFVDALCLSGILKQEINIIIT